MSDYQPALDQLRERRKGKPGELMLMLGLVLMICAPFALFLTNQEGERLAGLKSRGMVAEAQVISKSERSESYTDRKGRSKTRDIFSLELSHDVTAQLPYAEWKAGKPFPKPQYPAMTTRTIDVGQSYHDAAAVGQSLVVVQDPADYASMMLVEELEFETSFSYMVWWYLGVAAACLIGLVMAVMGWRKRFALG